VNGEKVTRRAPLMQKVPYYTILSGAAVAEAIALKARSLEVRSLQEYF
jgi:carbamoyl-phosphate synthase large subunit